MMARSRAGLAASAAASRVERERDAHETGLSRQHYEAVLSHTEWHYRAKRIRLAQDILRAERPRRVLELGSKSWLDFVGLAGVEPEEMVCINIAERELAVGRSKPNPTRVRPCFRIMDAHRLEFEDGHFDAVIGTGILHHLELDRALAEIRRVLRPDGLIVFGEPLDTNPVGRVVRALTPRARTADERPLRHDDLARIRAAFACRLHYEQLLSVPVGLVSRLLMQDADNLLTRTAFRLDEKIARKFAQIGPFYRKVMIVGRRPWSAASERLDVTPVAAE